MSYFCYSEDFEPLVLHASYRVICDLLWIDQILDGFTIVPISEKMFDCLTVQKLITLYENLGGEKKYTVKDFFVIQKLRNECVVLVKEFEISTANGFETGAQAAWIDSRLERGLDAAGYSFKSGSNIPKKL
jgi:hypothetical protein